MMTEEERTLAHELAQALNDRPSIGYYRKCAKTIPHEVLRDALSRTMGVKDVDVRASRARIFTSIIENYVLDQYGSTGD